MIILKFYNPVLQMGFADVTLVYKLPEKILLYTEVHQGCLHYRLPGSAKRISYKKLKLNLVKKSITLPLLPQQNFLPSL